MADHVAVFNHGRIMQVGTPQQIYRQPKSRFVAEFVGSSNVLDPDFVEKQTGTRGWASLRPEAITIGGKTGKSARIQSRAYLGAVTRLVLDLEGMRLNAVVPSGRVLPADGEIVKVSWKSSELHLMEDDR